MTDDEIEISYNATLSGDPDEIEDLVQILNMIKREPDLRPLLHDIMEIRNAVDEIGPAEKHKIRENTDFAVELSSGATSDILAVMKQYDIITNQQVDSSTWVISE